MIFGRPDFRIECAIPNVFNHADNRPDGFRSQVRIADLSADWILAGEIFLRQRLIDDHDFRTGHVLGIAEVAAADQFRANRLEKLRTHVPLIHFQVLAIVWLSNNANPVGVSVVGHRRQRRKRRGLHSGHALDFADDLPA